MSVITILFALLIGAAFGSFAGVVASRGWRASLGGRSHCDSCERTLFWYELIPLFSFVALRGRCRTCGAALGLSPLLWELGGALIALAVAIPLVLTLGE